MKKIFALGFLALSSLAARAEYEQINLTVFGMDCAPCAHAIHVSMKGIQGVNTVDVDLNTGLVSIKLAPGNNAAMRQFNEAVEKNGFTHKDANVINAASQHFTSRLRARLGARVLGPEQPLVSRIRNYYIRQTEADR